MAMKKNSFILILFITIFCSCNKDDLIWDLKKFATISTISATNISNTSVTINGEVKYDGGSTVIQRGVCWSTAPTPLLTGSHTTDSLGIGSFTSYITGLNAGTTYYVRAYATNSVGTAYGNQISFTTTNISASLPTLSTTSANSITNSTAVSGGNISSDGGSNVTQRGVCWSSTQNPSISNNITNSGTGIGSFTSSLTGLTANTIYYVKAFATNGVGTAYGNQISFTTTNISASLQIGQNYAGGIISFLDPTGQHGIIVAASDQAYIRWHVTSSGLTGANDEYDGAYNTNLIVANYGNESNAAKICYDLVLNGYNDWYLPSLDQLVTIYYNRSLIGAYTPINDYYWCSTEYDDSEAWFIDFHATSNLGACRCFFNPKNVWMSVRAVRSF
jgi:hypothetical protein